VPKVTLQIKVLCDNTKPLGYVKSDGRVITVGTNILMMSRCCDDCFTPITEETDYRNNGLCDSCKINHPFD